MKKHIALSQTLTIQVSKLVACTNDATKALFAELDSSLTAARVQSLIASGAQLNARNDQGDDFLSAAIMNFCSADVLEMLLEYGANPNVLNATGDTPLITALVIAEREIVALLLSYQADPNLHTKGSLTALEAACNNPNEQERDLLLTLLMTHHADPKVPFSIGCSIIYYLITQIPNSPYHIAHPVMHQLIKSGATLTCDDFDEGRNKSPKFVSMHEFEERHCGDGALHYAVILDNSELMAYLLNNHVPLLLRNSARGLNPWSMAILLQRKNLLTMLRKNYAHLCPVESPDAGGRSPIFLATLIGDRETFDFLVRQGANLSFHCPYNNTLWHAMAAGKFQPQIAKRFSEAAKVSPWELNNSGMLPVMVAMERNNKQAYAYLKPQNNDELYAVCVQAAKIAHTKSLIFLMAQGVDLDLIYVMAQHKKDNKMMSFLENNGVLKTKVAARQKTEELAKDAVAHEGLPSDVCVLQQEKVDSPPRSRVLPCKVAGEASKSTGIAGTDYFKKRQEEIKQVSKELQDLMHLLDVLKKQDEEEKKRNEELALELWNQEREKQGLPALDNSEGSSSTSSNDKNHDWDTRFSSTGKGSSQVAACGDAKLAGFNTDSFDDYESLGLKRPLACPLHPITTIRACPEGNPFFELLSKLISAYVEKSGYFSAFDYDGSGTCWGNDFTRFEDIALGPFDENDESHDGFEDKESSKTLIVDPLLESIHGLNPDNVLYELLSKLVAKLDGRFTEFKYDVEGNCLGNEFTKDMGVDLAVFNKAPNEGPVPSDG